MLPPLHEDTTHVPEPKLFIGIELWRCLALILMCSCNVLYVVNHGVHIKDKDTCVHVEARL